MDLSNADKYAGFHCLGRKSLSFISCVMTLITIDIYCNVTGRLFHDEFHIFFLNLLDSKCLMD